MSNSDFLSFFPESENAGPADVSVEELALLFNGLNEEVQEQVNSSENEDFSAMLDGIEMLEEMLVETELAGEEALQEMTPLEQETSVMFEGDDLQYEEVDEDNFAPSVLVPPFLRAHEALQEQVVSLGQRLAATEQELLGHQRRASSAENLIQDQAIALTQAQEQLAHTVAELQVYQEACKQQQLQVETLTEQLAASQDLIIAQQNQLHSGEHSNSNEVEIQELRTQVNGLKAENEQLKGQITGHDSEVARFEQQLAELSARLQRQQRYALQYKSALEQYLAQPDLLPMEAIGEVVANVTTQSKEVKPWASVGDVLASFTRGNAEPASAPVADLTPGLVNFSPSPDKEPADRPSASKKERKEQKNQAEEVPFSPPLEQAKSIAPIPAIDRLSFAVKEPKPSRRPIDLPGFLPRSTPMG
ncbi:hypothetical protein [Synechocystis sp. CACIAM 05]|uniref:hypothetical protein n=1 Tax=Synechocystis sp. CACIAM 05 TaxID=1933929 RepID=UPI00138E7594|nr:hypothetical protein [Synechocystis sp. CACIAM 05]QHV00288.1 hypothetical protein BWK47_09200 [Synechocystis sp. CACIAM 05]